jgi:hypothetical protein
MSGGGAGAFYFGSFIQVAAEKIPHMRGAASFGRSAPIV